MQRRHFDVLVSAAGLILAVVLIVLGIYFNDRYQFADDNVREQLSEQQIFFPPRDAMSDEELAQPDLPQYAGEQVTTGDQARVYANQFIGLHLEETAEGQTYAQLGTPERELEAEVEDARDDGDPELAQLEEELAEISEQRETLFRGETLRGLLLTTYGFWELGQQAQLATWLSWGGAAVLLVLAAAGFVHAFRTPREAKI